MSHPNHFHRSALAGMFSLFIALMLFANPISPHTLSAESAGQPDAAQLWTGWLNLGSPPNVPGLGWPVAGNHQDGRMEVFVGGDAVPGSFHENIYRIAQTEPNGGWGTWNGLGSLAGRRAGPSVVSNADGRLEVFAQSYWLGFGGDGGDHYEAAHIFQTAPNGAWGSWDENIGQPVAGNVVDLYEPYAGRNKDGRLAIFAKGEDGNIWLRQQTGAGVNTWSNWEDLSKPAVGVSPVLSVGWEQDGRLVVFAWGYDFIPYRIMQDAPNGNFGGWVGFNKPSGINLGQPFVYRNQDGRQEFYAKGTDGNIYHKYQLDPNGYWVGGYGNLGRPTGVTMGSPIAGHLPDGAQCIFGLGNDNNIWSRCQTCPNCGWGEWFSIGKPPTTNPTNMLATGNNQDGNPALFVVGEDGNLWVNQWTEFVIICNTLDVNLNPANGGVVVAIPSVNCGSQYVSGTEVELTAVATGGFNFSHWSGDAFGSLNPIKVTMDSDKAITAHFSLPGDKHKVYLPMIIR